MAFRSFIGSCATLTTSVANLTVLMVLKGEPGWICLTCCNADILFCVLVLHWVTSKEQKECCTQNSTNSNNRNATIGTRSFSRRRSTSLSKVNTADLLAEMNTISLCDTRTVYPFADPPERPQPALGVPGTIVTECKSDNSRKHSKLDLHDKLSSLGLKKDAVQDDEVELHSIRVERTQTQTTEASREDVNKTDYGEEWVGGRCSVVGEWMV